MNLIFWIRCIWCLLFCI